MYSSTHLFGDGPKVAEATGTSSPRPYSINDLQDQPGTLLLQRNPFCSQGSDPDVISGFLNGEKCSADRMVRNVMLSKSESGPETMARLAQV